MIPVILIGLIASIVFIDWWTEKNTSLLEKLFAGGLAFLISGVVSFIFLTAIISPLLPRHWEIVEIVRLKPFDEAGHYLLLGSNSQLSKQQIQYWKEDEDMRVIESVTTYMYTHYTSELEEDQPPSLHISVSRMDQIFDWWFFDNESSQFVKEDFYLFDNSILYMPN